MQLQKLSTPKLWKVILNSKGMAWDVSKAETVERLGGDQTKRNSVEGKLYFLQNISMLLLLSLLGFFKLKIILNTGVCISALYVVA